jgi:hypothetical protein
MKGSVSLVAPNFDPFNNISTVGNFLLLPNKNSYKVEISLVKDSYSCLPKHQVQRVLR